MVSERKTPPPIFQEEVPVAKSKIAISSTEVEVEITIAAKKKSSHNSAVQCECAQDQPELSAEQRDGVEEALQQPVHTLRLLQCTTLLERGVPNRSALQGAVRHIIQHLLQGTGRATSRPRAL